MASHDYRVEIVQAPVVLLPTFRVKVMLGMKIPDLRTRGSGAQKL